MELLAELDRITDFAVGFDHPAYYALLQHVKTAPHPPGHTQPPIVVDDWKNFAERPRDFRGVPVTIEGVVGVNRSYEHIRRRELGVAWQLELSGTRPQPCAATIICTDDAGDVPLGATIRVTGYFVMMRSYAGPSQRAQTAALLIASGPTQVSGAAQRDARVAAAFGSWWVWVVAPLLAGLLLAWLLLRRAAAGRHPRDPHALTARHGAPRSMADDLARWADADDEAQRGG